MQQQSYFTFVIGLVIGIGLAILFSGKSKSVPIPETNEIEKVVEKDSEGEPTKELSQQQPDLSLCPQEYVRYFGPLEPPRFHEDLPETLETNYVGEVKVNWHEVPDAARYHIVIYNEQGEEVEVVKTSRSIIYLKELPFNPEQEHTPFEIALRTESQKGRVGDTGERRKLIAQRLINLQAPSVKEIIVEE
jgi:hypothetical protein